jgi:amino acid adenylation domain-containing protein
MNFPPDRSVWQENGRESSVSEIFQAQCKQTPDLVAVSCGEENITYSELDKRSDLLSAHLQRIDKDSAVVGISSGKNIGMVIGLLAILKAGKAYLPLDPDNPPARIKQLIKETNIQTYLCIQNEIAFFNSLQTSVSTLATDGQYEERTATHGISSELIYVLFTSGSTGVPKGVCMKQSAMVNLLSWQQKNSVAGSGSKTLQFAPLGFDVSFQEIFSTLTTGGELVLVNDDQRLDPFLLLQLIEEKSIQRLFLPFVALQLLTEAANNHYLFPLCLKEIITAGEQLKITPQVIRFFSSIPDCILNNQYGPTETHVVTALKLEGNPDNWPALPSIGYPIDQTEIFILDKKGNEVKRGETGEICISGKSLAKEYFKQPDMTAEKFLIWHHPKEGDLRIYKTGDLGCYLSGGMIEFLGRIDEQVKIRGYRVEPGEIEVLMNKQAGVQQAVLVAREDRPGEKKLVAYLVSSNEKKDTVQLRNSLEKLLPDYMMPSSFIWVDEWPKTKSGKIDKKALPRPEGTRPELSVLYKGPTTATEKNISECWAEVLQIDRVGLLDNFFELGGNSLLALKTVAALKQFYGYEIPVTKIYQNPTVTGVVSFLEQAEKISAPIERHVSEDGNDIAVISMAGRFPGANTIEEFWNLLREGRETISFFTTDDLDASIPDDLKNNPDYVKARGIIDQAESFDASFFGINLRLAELMDPQQRVFLEIAWEVLESGGYQTSKYKGTIGVFAGTGNNTYYLNNVQGHPDLIGQVGSFQVMTANEKDYVASRTAYELNLKGPAVSVHSACSTSLLAIAEAVSSLRKGQCDMALAGGVAVTVPIKSGHIYQEGAMYSRDGHNRSFDADAAGTVFSDGAGVVLLKKLDRAIADGDTIFSIIKGIGINNDGGEKGSFTAPSAEGQAGAIRMAIHDAGINPSRISYIEAHGTATPLGDPIEIEGLNLAFGPQEKVQFCALGSVKSNIGHCTAAAGVAGFIKTTLALHHKKIPASINFKNPNPHIQFQQSPFYVNERLKDWQTEDIRVAGVSSFGVGGTNVHVILEEYKYPSMHHPKNQESNKPGFLISLSAKTEKSMEAYASKLASYLSQHETIEIAELAYTLHTSREQFNFRRFLVATDRKELLEKLKLPASSQEHIVLKEHIDGVIFVFPGQGSQYLNMGKELYEQEPVFRKAIDECAELLMPLMKEDIREIIFPALNDSEAEKKIQNTYYTQPALFIIEYAIAKLWISWGIQPVAFIGHSIGEFVAAHLAGVFSLQDGLRLISARGRLMSNLPSGSMLSARLGAEKIIPLLPESLSLAAINGPNLSVISGPENIVKEFSKLLTAGNIPNKKLHTSHAFHSSMMDPMQADFETLVSSIHMTEPRIPIVSTMTGTWIGKGEMTKPSYWSDQIRKPVRFAEAIKCISEKGNLLILESGPGRVLSNLVKHQGIKKNIPAIASLDGDVGQSDWQALMKAMGQIWMNGIEPDWKLFYKDQKRVIIPVVSYAFDRTRCWVDPVSPAQSKILAPVVRQELSSSSTFLPTENKKVKINKDRKSVLIEKLKKIFENASGIEMESVSSDSNFIEIGFDSLLLTQVALNCKKEFGLPISFRQLNETYTSLDLLAVYLDEQLPKEEFYEEQNTDVREDPSSLKYLSTQIEMLARQVADMQKGEKAPGSVAKPIVLSQRPGTEDLQLSEEEKAELRKPFGATARIEKRATALNERQQKFLVQLTQRYNQKTGLSKSYNQEHRSYMADPRVVSGFKPLTKELVYSIVVNKSKGSHLWDLDGNEYIDALNGFGSNLLGYQPEIITQALHRQIDIGYELGPQHALAGKVCKLICEFTQFDRSALCNTGSEAVLGAMRIARTVTGRSLIVAFSGSYHGIVDEVIVRGTKKLKSFPAAPGIMPEAVQNMLILDYGTEESLAIIKERAHELAAVLVEPVQSRRPEFQPIEFLKVIRKITSESGTALIFDEVITGFRMHPGGAQAIFGIQADLGTYGKVVAGGLPIGIIAGRKLFMDALDGGFWEYGNSSVPESGVTYFAGTFVRHPLALAASLASLEYLKAKGPGLQASINEKTLRLADALNKICIKNGLPIYIAQFGSLWKIKFKEEIPYGELLFTLMREKGIHIWDGFPCFLTEAHDTTDIKTIIEKFEESVKELIDSGFFISSKAFHFVPAIEPQMEIWISCLLGGSDASRAYNESVSLRLTGTLNLSALDQALKEIIHRHEALRSTFSEDGKQICVYRDMPLSLRIEELADKTQVEQETFITSFKKQNALEVFDLVKGPLFRADLFKLNREEFYLTLTAHHIICDGWSLGIILQDLGKFYAAFNGNITPELKPAASLNEYAEAQNIFAGTDEYRKIEHYWLKQFQQSIPVLDIPTDFPRPEARTYKSHRLDFPLESSLVNAVKKMGAQSGCTFVTTLMAAYEVFLQQISGQQEIILGIPAAGQSVTGLYNLVGHCVNLLPMRSHPDGKILFSEYLKLRKSQVLNDYEHQQITFGSLLQKLNIARDRSRIPLIPLTFNVDLGLDDGVEFPGLKYKMVYNSREYENFEISLNVSGSVDNVEVQWSYNTQLFKESTIQLMMKSFENLLHQLVTEPGMRIKDLLTQDLRQAVSEDGDSTYQKDKSIAYLFSEQANRTPFRRALSFGNKTLTYQQLEEKSNQLANYLKSKGIKREEHIPVCLDRSEDLVIAILAILKAGGTYVPLDPEYPAERIRLMLEDTRAKIILCNRNNLDILGTPSDHLIILMDEERYRINQESTGSPLISGDGSDLAYIMYTSGSTGRPKGVMIENRNVISLVRGINYMNLSGKNVLLSTSSASFDASSFEYWSMLLNGGELILCPEQDLLNSEMLKQEIRKRKVNIMWFTSSLLNQWVELDISVFETLRTVITGGEKLSEKHIEKLRNRYPLLEIINGYGPTENTTFSLTYPVKERQITKPIPIGVPFNNRTAYVLNHQLQLCGVGQIGELYVGGAGVGRGYLNRPDLTGEKFIPDPFISEPGSKMYRTGDLARQMPDGNFEYHGRLDEQIKIRGFRIEPAEIESAILEFPGVQQTVVIAREDISSEKRLIAYIVSRETFRKAEISSFLQRKLPAYMIPRVFIPLSRIPLNAHGKVDKKSLPDPDLLPEFEDKKMKEAETETQKMLAAIWKEALHLPQLSIDDNFFELGGHSLIAVRVMKLIEEKSTHRLPVTALFEAPTIEKLSLMLDRDEKKDVWKSLVQIKPGNKPPLYIVHGSGLTVLIFHALAMGLDADQPVFGLQARGLNGVDEPFDNMEEIAAYYVGEIRVQNPNGPYNLAGYSFGGIVAFEMARQLKAMGQEVNMLAIFDTNADHSYQFDDWALKMRKKFKRQFPKFKFILRSFKKYPADTMAYQIGFLKKKFNHLLISAGIVKKIDAKEEHLDFADKINDKHNIAFEKYKLDPYNGSIDLFRVKNRMYFLDDPVYLGWKPYALQGIDVHEISGDHKTFLVGPNVKELSLVLGRILDQRNAGKEIRKNFADPSSVLKAI